MPNDETFNLPCQLIAPTTNDDTLTLDKVLEAARSLRREPIEHPLNGADTLYYADNMKDHARDLARAVNEGGWARAGTARVVAMRSIYVPNGYIIGKRAGDIVLIVGPEPVR